MAKQKLLSQMKFRVAKFHDLNAISDLDHSFDWNLDKFRRYFQHHSSMIVVGQFGERYIGFACFRFGLRRVTLDRISVHQKFLRRGIGECLINWMEVRYMDIGGLDRILTKVNEYDLRSQQFFASCDFLAIRCEADRIVFRRSLDLGN